VDYLPPGSCRKRKGFWIDCSLVAAVVLAVASTHFQPGLLLFTDAFLIPAPILSCSTTRIFALGLSREGEAGVGLVWSDNVFVKPGEGGTSTPHPPMITSPVSSMMGPGVAGGAAVSRPSGNSRGGVEGREGAGYEGRFGLYACVSEARIIIIPHSHRRVQRPKLHRVCIRRYLRHVVGSSEVLGCRCRSFLILIVGLKYLCRAEEEGVAVGGRADYIYLMSGEFKVKAYTRAVSERRRAGQIQGHLDISLVEGEFRPRLQQHET
jgi:hypothetical protein